MNPYRKSGRKQEILNKKAPFWRTIYRKYLIRFWYGRFKDRKPDKCHHCGKRSRAIGNSFRTLHLNYYDCGCRRLGHWKIAM